MTAWPRTHAVTDEEVASAAAAVAARAVEAQVPGRMPAVYLGHGAPPLLDDQLWVAELAAWAGALPRPSAVLMVSAHWTQAPLTLGATEAGVPLIYDFYGFPDRYYQARYPAPPAPELARRVADLAGGEQAVAHEPSRGLDHGAYVPLVAMYPDADVPVLQLSLPTLDPERLLETRRAAAAAARRGRPHHRQRLHDPRAAVPARVRAGRAAAGLVEGLRPVGGGGPRSPRSGGAGRASATSRRRGTPTRPSSTSSRSSWRWAPPRRTAHGHADLRLLAGALQALRAVRLTGRQARRSGACRTREPSAEIAQRGPERLGRTPVLSSAP